ncbi:unnamed protein product [Allacma fusca]|uniref:Uncharacterized protein n=1 Tax=Allacma fusca TaxID=39272 RepID=A0A8J2L1D4_9HEXA|nr:unnamed protein product [Allacma fusca]
MKHIVKTGIILITHQCSQNQSPLQVRLLVVNSDSQSQTATFLINSEDLITITLRLFTFWTAQFAPLFVR